MFLPVIVAIIEYAFLLAIMKFKSENQYNNQLVRKMELRRLLGHIDIYFFCLNIIFLPAFIPFFFTIVPTAEKF